MATSPSSKIQPLDKTIVTEFKLHVADIHMRSRQMNGSQACRVDRTGSFSQGDSNVSTTDRVTLNNVKRMVAIQGWSNLLISLENATGVLEDIPCSGLFIMYGSFDKVTVRAAMEGDPVRITYVFA